MPNPYIPRLRTRDLVNFPRILGDGEPVIEIDTGQLKVGDGERSWSDLPYYPNLREPAAFPRTKTSLESIDARDFITNGDLDLGAVAAAAVALGTRLVRIPPDRVYSVPSGKHYIDRDAAAIPPVILDATGATIECEDKFYEVDSFGTFPTLARPLIRGGRYIGPGGVAGARGGTWCRMTDTGGVRQIDCDVYDFGTINHHRNFDNFSETFVSQSLRAANNDRLAIFDGAPDTGGPGTSSFARTRYLNTFFSGGAGKVITINDGASCYDSTFQIVGNLSSQVTHLVRLGGGLAGAVYDLRIEAQAGGSPYLFTAGVTASQARLSPWPILRNQIALLDPASGKTAANLFSEADQTPPSELVNIPSGGTASLISASDVRGAGFLMVDWPTAQSRPAAVFAIAKSSNASAAAISALVNAPDSQGQTLTLTWPSGGRPTLGLTGGAPTAQTVRAWFVGVGTVGWQAPHFGAS